MLRCSVLQCVAVYVYVCLRAHVVRQKSAQQHGMASQGVALQGVAVCCSNMEWLVNVHSHSELTSSTATGSLNATEALKVEVP